MTDLLRGTSDAGQSIVRAIAWRALSYQEVEPRWPQSNEYLPSEGHLGQTLLQAMVLGWRDLAMRLGDFALRIGERADRLGPPPDRHVYRHSFMEVYGSAFPIACLLFQKWASHAGHGFDASAHLEAHYRPLIEALDKPDSKAFAEAVALAAKHHLEKAVPFDVPDTPGVHDYVMALDAFFPVEIFAAMLIRREEGLEVAPPSDPWLAESYAYFTSLPSFEPDPLYGQVVERLEQERRGFVYTPPGRWGAP